MENRRTAMKNLSVRKEVLEEIQDKILNPMTAIMLLMEVMRLKGEISKEKYDLVRSQSDRVAEFIGSIKSE